MGFFIGKSETEIKVSVFLILWGIRWLYKYLAASDDSTSQEELDEAAYADANKVKNIAPPMPITPKVVDQAAQPVPLRQAITANPPPAAHVIAKHKTASGRKRRLFRNILLVDALMQRKNFTV
ncbi:hypothetical protein [Candidatus Cardinium sp. TP]|uniref:hypothetical protein n=1 Tax=Candidatus Cardinium sp. TP TaxID=2961955 RepID=UPI0021B079E9|nr:hypothetical protein [Candidatus Cardinium sp. TP]MCT4696792.1 hypothetical protein [Candidatus Cardinium sp. TP]MDN5246799.1 hypothetical protein [Candidatus Cardinium sp.]